MNKLITTILLMVAITAAAQPSYPPASQSEVNAGTVSTKFVSPKTLRGAGVMTNIPAASASTAGSMSTNDYQAAQSTAGYNEVYRIPWKGIYDLFTESQISNAMVYLKSSGLYQRGFNHVLCDISGITNSPDGYISVQPGNFPSGQGYFSLVHTNGFLAGQWYDPQNLHGQTSITNLPTQVYSLATNLWDELWTDVEGYGAYQAAEIVQTNRPQKSLILGYALTASEKDNRSISRANAFRVHGAHDLSSWSDVQEYCDLMATNLYRYVRPYRYGFWAATSFATPKYSEAQSIQRMECIFSLIFDEGPRNAGSTLEIFVTNCPATLGAHDDPGVICGRLSCVTNGFYWIVKPRTQPGGPAFTIMALNTNTVANTSSVTWSQLNNNLPPGFALSATNYSLYSNESNVWLSQFSLGITAALTNHESACFDLWAAPAVWTNTTYQGSNNNFQVVISNGVPMYPPSRVVWSSAVSNYCVNAGITDPLEIADIQQLYDELNQPVPSSGKIPYTNIDAFWPVPDSTSNACSMEFKSATRGTWSANNPSFNNLGMAGDGTNAWFVSNVSLTNAGRAYQLNSSSVYIYSQTQSPIGSSGTLNVFCSAFNNGGTARVGLYMNGATTLLAFGPNNSDGTGGQNVSSDFRGPLAVVRTNSTAGYSFAKGTSFSVIPTTASVSVPDAPFTIGSRNFIGFTPDLPSNIRVSFAFFGGGWTADEMLWVNNIIDRYNARRGHKSP